MQQLRMSRPHLDDLPEEPSLPDGYALTTYTSADDIASLAETLTGAFGEIWDEARVRDKLTDAPDVLAVYVATWRGRAVATTSSRWQPDRFPATGYVHWVGTHPEHLRRGLGLALMIRVLHDFRARGYRAAVLETDDSRLPAIRTYLRCGFLPVYEAGDEDHRARWSAVCRAIFGG